MNDLPYNIEIKHLSEFVEEEDESLTVVVESMSKYERKELTRVKKLLESEDKLIEYRYVGRQKDKPAFGEFKVQRISDVSEKLNEDMAKRVKATGFGNVVPY